MCIFDIADTNKAKRKKVKENIAERIRTPGLSINAAPPTCCAMEFVENGRVETSAGEICHGRFYFFGFLFVDSCCCEYSRDRYYQDECCHG